MTIEQKLKCPLGDECPHERQLKFNRFVRDFLPNSEDHFLVSDIDWYYYYPESKKVAFLEQKTRGREQEGWQKMMFDQHGKWITSGIETIGDGWKTLGHHYLTFENYCFDDGLALLDGKLVTADEFIKIVNDAFGYHDRR
jgi:hypothetical protein